jgi:hypothetical protein
VPHHEFSTSEREGCYDVRLTGYSALNLTRMVRTLHKLLDVRAAALLALVGLSMTSAVALAEGAAAPTLAGDAEHWTAYGFNITAPASVWPMLELLHRQHFDWELASASRRPTPIVWASLPPGVYGQYSPTMNVVRLSGMLQGSSVEAGTAFLAHELTHLTDDLNGQLGDMAGGACYAAEVRAFVNEANFWQMVVGPLGKTTQDAIEMQENAKMFAFVGNSRFADLVVRTTGSYVKQCGPDRSR